MKWWDDHAALVYGTVGLVFVIIFALYGITSVFFGVSELSGMSMGFGILGVMTGCVITGIIISKLVGLVSYATIDDTKNKTDLDDEDEISIAPIVIEDDHEDDGTDFEHHVNGPLEDGSR